MCIRDRGGTDKSYGVYVGKLAGIPERVLKRAEQIQDGIEEKEDIVIKKEFKSNMTKLDKKICGNSNLNGFI